VIGQSGSCGCSALYACHVLLSYIILYKHTYTHFFLPCAGSALLLLSAGVSGAALLFFAAYGRALLMSLGRSHFLVAKLALLFVLFCILSSPVQGQLVRDSISDALRPMASLYGWFAVTDQSGGAGIGKSRHGLYFISSHFIPAILSFIV